MCCLPNVFQQFQQAQVAPTRVYSSLLDVLHDAADDDIAILVGQGIHVQLICAVQVLVHQHRALRVYLHRVLYVAFQILGAAGQGSNYKVCHCKAQQSARALTESAGVSGKVTPTAAKLHAVHDGTQAVHIRAGHQSGQGRGELFTPAQLLLLKNAAALSTHSCYSRNVTLSMHSTFACCCKVLVG